MRAPTSTQALTPARHIVGACLLLFAVSSLALAAMLPMQSSKGVELPFLDDSGAPIVVGFAGFPGCGDVCPAGMALLGHSARQLSVPDRQDVSLLFINLQRGTPASVSNAYARAFHPEFYSYTVALDESDLFYRELALRSFSPDESAVTHSGYFYVFVRERGHWRIQHVYRRPPAASQLVNDLESLAATLAKGA